MSRQRCGATKLDGLLAPEGWPYASSLPTDARDPGRFHALFGRDSLITSLQILPLRPDVARATVRALAELQGKRTDPGTLEEPGKIIHEYRVKADADLQARGFPVRGGQLRYFASADSTSWFLVLLASIGDVALEQELGRAWVHAGEWVLAALSRGGGLVRHTPAAGGGLVQQGWRDAVDPTDASGGGIVDAYGKVPAAPLADVETQAVTTVALRALSVMSGHDSFFRESVALGHRIAKRFDANVIAIDALGAPVRGAGSHLGWLLWADCLPSDAARMVATRLITPDILTPWGLRTLSDQHPAFDPRAYHRGTVWPFDSWIGWGGLRACGYIGEAEKVRIGVLSALEQMGSAPELYEVYDSGPRRSPLANQVQAWTMCAKWALEAKWDGRSSRLFAPSASSPTVSE